jgi:predicted acyltransferase
MSTVSTVSGVEAAPVLHPVNKASSRLISLDVFRGTIVAGMLLVTNAGSWDHVYWPLKHADWNGVTPTDMIFPSFLFLAGVSMVFSFAARRRKGISTGKLAAHVVWRSVSLIVLGLVLNGFPLFDLHPLRIPGILQRIGLCCLGAGLFYLALPHEETKAGKRVATTLAAIVALMVFYWALLRFVPVPGYGAGRLDQAGNLGAYIDRSLFGTNHLWFYGGQMWDPEGLLSTLTACCNMLLGIVAGEWLRREGAPLRRLARMAGTGLLLMVASLALNPVIPINKKIWTDSFVLFSGGFSLLVVALLSWVIDERGWKRGTTLARIFGTNAILAFSLATMLNALEPLFHFTLGGKAETIREALFDGLARGLNPSSASLGYALLFVVLNLAIVGLFYRKKIFLRL